MIHSSSCPHCRNLEAKLKQHERYIAQLVDIVAKTKEKLMELESRMSNTPKTHA